MSAVTQTQLDELLSALAECARELAVARTLTPLCDAETTSALLQEYGTKADEKYRTNAEEQAIALLQKHSGRATQ